MGWHAGVQYNLYCPLMQSAARGWAGGAAWTLSCELPSLARCAPLAEDRAKPTEPPSPCGQSPTHLLEAHPPGAGETQPQ